MTQIPHTEKVRKAGALITCFGSRPANWRFVPDWVRSLASPATPLQAQVPWLPYLAIDYLEHVVRPSSTVWEYGGGGSTLWFARRAGRLVTVEDDAAWHDRIRQALDAADAGNCDLLLRPPRLCRDGEPDEDAIYRKPIGPDLWEDFTDYVTAIDHYDDETFDLVLVDGRVRPACLTHAVPKVRRGGLIVLDDSEPTHAYGRETREVSARLFAGWPRRDFFGIRRFERTPSQTTCWTRP